jgi:hypothetical protein
MVASSLASVNLFHFYSLAIATIVIMEYCDVNTLMFSSRAIKHFTAQPDKEKYAITRNNPTPNNTSHHPANFQHFVLQQMFRIICLKADAYNFCASPYLPTILPTTIASPSSPI